MPVYKNSVIFEIARGIKAFLNLEFGLVRGEIPRFDRLKEGARRNTMRGKAPDPGGINPENMIWVFGSGRTGSTWLSSMMGEIEGHTEWREPLVGALFGYFYYVRAQNRGETQGKNFIMSEKYRDTWLASIRTFILDAANARFPKLSRGDHLVIKEPNGSVGAPLIMEALPESRMILLVRDPRDVIASTMDARKKGAWLQTSKGKRGDQYILSDDPGDKAVRKRLSSYLRMAGNAKKAYDAHQGRKVAVRYEDLRRDALGVMEKIYAELNIPASEEQLSTVVEKHSWENIPAEKKGEGRFHRKGTPGGWKEDLTPDQAEIVERIAAPIVEEFYPE